MLLLAAAAACLLAAFVQLSAHTRRTTQHTLHESASLNGAAAPLYCFSLLSSLSLSLAACFITIQSSSVAYVPLPDTACLDLPLYLSLSRSCAPRHQPQPCSDRLPLDAACHHGQSTPHTPINQSTPTSHYPTPDNRCDGGQLTYPLLHVKPAYRLSVHSFLRPSLLITSLLWLRAQARM